VDLPDFCGNAPFYLLFVEDSLPEGVLPLIVDLDESGWMAKHGVIFRSVGELHLVRKVGDAVVLSVHLFPGEQGYYVARHIGFASGGAGEVTAYGIGKKRVDDNEDNLWVLPWGQICGGKDVEYFATKGLKRGL
jgi:hypothetical protein